MFGRPGFARDKGVGGSGDGLPIVHELDSQAIQGGKPGEHYHLNQHLHDQLSLNGIQYSEPILTATSEFMFSEADGDIMMSLASLVTP